MVGRGKLPVELVAVVQVEVVVLETEPTREQAEVLVVEEMADTTH
jgi:hypothetical protein